MRVPFYFFLLPFYFFLGNTVVSKLTTGALVSVGLLLVAWGIQKWFDNRQAAETVDAFMHAVEQGDRDAALALLDPRQRRVAEGKRQIARWEPDPGLEYRIHHIDISGDDASAQLWIEKDGIVVQPTLTLHRSETGQWKIDVDRIWEDLRQARSRKQGEQLANELSETLKGRPGVVIDRVPMTDPH